MEEIVEKGSVVYDNQTKRGVRLFVQTLIVLVILTPILIWFSIEPEYAIFGVIVLWALWRRRKGLFLRLKRAGIIVSIVFVAFTFLGGVLWATGGSQHELFAAIMGGIFIIIAALAFYN